MSVAKLSPSTQNYLKAIWGLQEWSDDPVTATTLAAKTGLRMSTVSGAITKLAEQGLVDHAPYGAITLTAEGRGHALAMVRRHRLIETFLVTTLGFRSDQVHDEAEHLEHCVSDFLVERIAEALGHPDRDPHGDPIPAVDGSIRRPNAVPLGTVPAPATVVVERLSDDDAELLRFLDSQGVELGAVLNTQPGPPYSGTLVVSVAGGEPFSLGRQAAEAIWVAPGR